MKKLLGLYNVKALKEKGYTTETISKAIYKDVKKKSNICHLVETTPSEDNLVPTKDHFEVIKTFVDESHLFRYLLKCKKCGQLFFYEFYEEIDWKEGKDSQYSTYIPVNSKEEAEDLNKKSQIELLGVLPRLQSDFVGDKKTIKWAKAT